MPRQGSHPLSLLWTWMGPLSNFHSPCVSLSLDVSSSLVLSHTAPPSTPKLHLMHLLCVPTASDNLPRDAHIMLFAIYLSPTRLSILKAEILWIFLTPSWTPNSKTGLARLSSSVTSGREGGNSRPVALHSLVFATHGNCSLHPCFPNHCFQASLVIDSAGSPTGFVYSSLRQQHISASLDRIFWGQGFSVCPENIGRRVNEA